MTETVLMMMMITAIQTQFYIILLLVVTLLERPISRKQMLLNKKCTCHTNNYNMQVSIITDSGSAYTFLITYYQVNAHCVVQIITKVETYT